jgi:hypothetical protein
MMAKNNEMKYLAVDKDDCVGMGKTLIEAANNLAESSGAFIADFTYYKLTKINVELKEVD